MDAAARRRYYANEVWLSPSLRGTHKRVSGTRRIFRRSGCRFGAENATNEDYGLPTTRQSSPAAFIAVQRSCAAATVVNGPVCTR
jgi:hypothetical protein